MVNWVATFIVALMIISAVFAVEKKDLLEAVVGMTAASLFVSILMFFLKAPDVAMTEASIGAALSAAIFIFAIKRTKRYVKDEKASGWWIRW